MKANSWWKMKLIFPKENRSFDLNICWTDVLKLNSASPKQCSKLSKIELNICWHQIVKQQSSKSLYWSCAPKLFSHTIFYLTLLWTIVLWLNRSLWRYLKYLFVSTHSQYSVDFRKLSIIAIRIWVDNIIYQCILCDTQFCHLENPNISLGSILMF